MIDLKNCRYCDEDRMIDCAGVWYLKKKKGTIACINSQNELVVNIDGGQANIPVKFCPFCGSRLEEYFRKE
jgi:hypothetical protein